MKRIYCALLAGALVFASSCLAADKNDSKHMDPYVQDPQNEARLIQEVRHQLVLLPYFGVFDDVGFTVDAGGRVTLVGEVTQPVLKTDAETVVKKVEGVTAVVNKIESTTTSTSATALLPRPSSFLSSCSISKDNSRRILRASGVTNKGGIANH